MTTWMLLEDEPDLYEMVLAMYEMLGVNGVAFGNGIDTLGWIDDVEHGRYQGELPELALLDIRLPDNISGSMVSARLRQSPVLRDMVIVLMTAYRLTPTEEAEIMAQAGADYLLNKPLPHIYDLESLLREMVAQR
ncbi:MAG: hypothetical protein OHK0046_16320 [Anaerolineae bacterium]